MELMLSNAVSAWQLFDPSLTYAEDLDVSLYCRNLMVANPDLRLGFVDEFAYIWLPETTDNISTNHTEVEQGRITQAILRKHGISELRETLLKKNLARPFFWLPKWVKRPLIPLKHAVHRLSGGRLYNPSHGIVELNLDPYWFDKLQYNNTAQLISV